MKIQKPNRDEYRRTVNIVKDELGVEFHTRNLSSYEDCKKALRQIIFKYFIGLPNDYEGMKLSLQQFEYVQTLEREVERLNHINDDLLVESHHLKKELGKNKKWWQFWR